MEHKNIQKCIRLLTISLLTGVAILFQGCGGDDPRSTGPEYKEVQVARGVFQILVTANGVVIPIDRVEIKSKASGEVVELPVEQGDLVSKGDLIARLDQKDERANLAQAQADLDIAEAQLKESQSAFDRRQDLFQKQLISVEERDQIVLNLAVAKGKLVQASTSRERAQERLSEAVVRAPIDGTILQKYVEEGQIIASGVSNVGGGTPIVDIADMGSVYIEAGIDEIDIGKVRLGQSAAVIAEAYPDRTFRGKIVRIAPEAKVEQNVTLFDVVVEVENTDFLLKSGMNTGIEVSIINEPDVLLVPAIAFQSPDQKAGPRTPKRNGKSRPEGREKGHGKEKTSVRTVLIKQGDGFVPREVKIGRSNFQQAVVLSGLEEGDVLGVPLTSRLKAENDRREDRIRSSRSFGTGKSSSSSR